MCYRPPPPPHLDLLQLRVLGVDQVDQVLDFLHKRSVLELWEGWRRRCEVLLQVEKGWLGCLCEWGALAGWDPLTCVHQLAFGEAGDEWFSCGCHAGGSPSLGHDNQKA